MRVPVFITGTGLVTAQGVGVETNWTNLLVGRVLHGTGLVPLDRDPALPRVSQLAIRAAVEAHTAAGLPPQADARVALVVGTSKGPVEDWIDQLNGRRPPDVTLGVARVAADVAAATGHARGPRLTYAGACASGLHALIRATDLIRQGVCDRAMVVAAEASTHALFAANFVRLGVLADPADGCRPFDERRGGFLLAEGAAAVWLSREPAMGAVQVDAGLALADASHLTGVDRDGLALRHLLETLDLPAIDLIHAHGTGTPLNDEVEFAASEATLRQYEPSLYSHKHAVGHTQGAAGLIGVVLNVEMHRRSVVPGNTNTTHPMPGTPGKGYIDFRRDACASKIHRSIVIAAGFGGTLAAVRLGGVLAADEGDRPLSVHL